MHRHYLVLWIVKSTNVQQNPQELQKTEKGIDNCTILHESAPF